MPEAAAANRCLGLTCLIQGDLTAAQAHLGEALRTCRPEWDQETKVRFGADTGATAMAYLAQTMWLLGEFGQARALIDGAVARAVETAHIQTQCNTYTAKSLLDGLRGDTEDASNAAEVVVQLGRRHGLPLYLAWGTVLLTWASSRLGDRKTGLAKLEEALCAYSDQGNRAYVPFFQGLLAEIEAEEDADAAVWRIGEALALAGETKQRWGDAYLHRAYGEALLKRNPADASSAEEAFLTAIGIAQQQKSRSFELRAALALAKLYQSSKRAADAHAVLAPTLEGFSPTPELPQIEEAQALLTALAETDEVKRAVTARERRVKLQTAYGLAVAWSRGFASEETKAAFTRASELSASTDNSDERFTTLYGRWVTSLMRGELDLARQTAETFLREAENAGRIPETLAALRYLGLTSYNQGRFVEARTHLEEVLRAYDPGRDGEANFRFGTDTLASATIYLALVYWRLGDFKRARELSVRPESS
jgi:tetratricopeptide (TPR) repeat protein